METLVEAAKRLGIKPNPSMTVAEKMKVFQAIKDELGYWQPSQMYNALKRVPQHFNEKKCMDNINFQKLNAAEGVSIYTQDSEKVSLNEDGSFVWHDATTEGRHTVERFQIELQLDHPNLPECLEHLDAFIKKYHSKYKISDQSEINRSDPLNVYMTVPITPEITKELYSIVGPYLKDEHHDFLNGFSIKMGGKEVKGIKYGPEPISYGRKLSAKTKERVRASMVEEFLKLPPAWRDRLDNFPSSKEGLNDIISGKEKMLCSLSEFGTILDDTESLGECSAMVQYMDLIYYMAGKEGQSPFQLGNQYGLPLDGSFPERLARKYVDKKIDIADVAHTVVRPSVSKTPVPVSKVEPSASKTVTPEAHAETLVEMVKRWGITPNPHMSKEEFVKLQERIKATLGWSGMWYSVDYAVYQSRKKAPQRWNEAVVAKNIEFLKKMSPKGIRVHDQDGVPVELNGDATFVWHNAEPKGVKSQERFAISIQLDHPQLPQLFERLDTFIKKHQAAYKVTDFDHIQRTDPINLYMTKPITPEIAQELYGIVKPFIKESNHKFLDGLPISAGKEEIKGIKYGPEPCKWGDTKLMPSDQWTSLVRKMKKRFSDDLPEQFGPNSLFSTVKNSTSLGEVSANVQWADLLYYLAGKEGQSPIKLGNQYGLPIGSVPERVAREYDKKIDIADVGRTSVKAPVVAPTPHPVHRAPSPKPAPVVAPIPSASKPTRSRTSVRGEAPKVVSPSAAPASHPAHRTTSPEPASIVSAPKVSNPILKSGHLNLKDLLQELRSLTAEIQAARSELTQLRRENSQIRGKLFEILRENALLRSQNELLKTQVSAAFPSVVVKTAKNHGKS